MHYGAKTENQRFLQEDRLSLQKSISSFSWWRKFYKTKTKTKKKPNTCTCNVAASTTKLFLVRSCGNNCQGGCGFPINTLRSSVLAVIRPKCMSGCSLTSKIVELTIWWQNMKDHSKTCFIKLLICGVLVHCILLGSQLWLWWYLVRGHILHWACYGFPINTHSFVLYRLN